MSAKVNLQDQKVKTRRVLRRRADATTCSQTMNFGQTRGLNPLDAYLLHQLLRCPESASCIIGKTLRGLIDRIATMAQLTIHETFNLAVQHQQAGRLREAEQLYRQILVRQPNHAAALHLLGVIAAGAGRNDIAVEKETGTAAHFTVSSAAGPAWRGRASRGGASCA